MVEEILVNGWNEFDATARKLVADGFSDIMPNDSPLRLRIGYMFFKPGDDDNAKSVQARVKTLTDRPPDIVKAMSSEAGRASIARSWGNYKPYVPDPNIPTLSVAQMNAIMMSDRVVED